MRSAEAEVVADWVVSEEMMSAEWLEQLGKREADRRETPVPAPGRRAAPLLYTGGNPPINLGPKTEPPP